MVKVGIVTDSTCDLTPEQLTASNVRMVPLKVLFGEETFLDWSELRPEEFYTRLKNSPVLPKTSQPSPAEFKEAYQELVDAGCDGIVSIHLTSALSGTYESAMLAAKDCVIPVHVVDTKKVSQAVGLVVSAAVAARDAGADVETVAERARSVAGSMRLYFVLDTLDYLVKGGRAGKAQGLAASLLNIKPVLEVNADGIVAPFKKAKGRRKAFSELAAHLAEEARESGPMKVAMLHACEPEAADELWARIEETGAPVERVTTGLVGAVIGTYAGPGAAGCAYYPAE